MSKSPIAARPAEPFADVKARAAAAVEAARDELLDLSHRIHANPEPAFEEHQAAAWCAEAVARHGFAVEHPVGSLSTAVRGRLTGGKGGDGPRIAVLAEYDALPGLGHGCGHNTMAASGVGAAIALAATRDDWAGEVVFLGTPAEERGSGKEIMLRDGLFEGIDAAAPLPPLRPQPRRVRAARIRGRGGRVQGSRRARGVRSLGGEERARRADRPVRLRGPVAPAAADALPGPRDRPGGRHGGQHHPGPDPRLVHDPKRQPALLRRRHEAPLPPAVRGSRPRRRRRGGGRVLGLRVNDEAQPRPRGSLERQRGGLRDPRRGDGPRPRARRTWRNVSWVVPAIHPDLSISDVPIPGHTTEFRDAAGRPRADRTVLLAATLVAQTALDLLLDPSVAEAAWREFRGQG